MYLPEILSEQLSTQTLFYQSRSREQQLSVEFAMMVNFNKACSAVAAAVLEYDTNKIVHIKSKKVGLINRLIQLVIIAYVVGYVIIYEKGYQSTGIGLTSVTTKVKGTALTNLSIQFPVKVHNKTVKNTLYDGPRIWDSSDYVIPPEENNAVFVMTNMIITSRQEQGKCPEDKQYRDARCQTDADCHKGKEVLNGHGIMTGKCVLPDRPVHGNYNMCEIFSWCPVEFDKLPMPGTNNGKKLKNNTCLLEEAVNFTILIKNAVQFPKHDVSFRNVNEKQNKTYLKQCNFDAHHHKLCPIFKLKTIFDEISDTAFNDAAIKGGVVAIKIKWDCDLDRDHDDCLPQYSFSRLDNARGLNAAGYNFRFASYDVENNIQYRTLIKAYGIRFVILVDAKAGKFDIIPLLRNLGAGVALLGIATVMCDICVLYLLKKKYFYRTKKYQYVDDPDGKDSSDNEMSPQRPDSPGYGAFVNE